MPIEQPARESEKGVVQDGDDSAVRIEREITPWISSKGSSISEVDESDD